MEFQCIAASLVQDQINYTADKPLPQLSDEAFYLVALAVLLKKSEDLAPNPHFQGLDDRTTNKAMFEHQHSAQR